MVKGGGEEGIRKMVTHLERKVLIFARRRSEGKSKTYSLRRCTFLQNRGQKEILFGIGIF